MVVFVVVFVAVVVSDAGKQYQTVGTTPSLISLSQNNDDVKHLGVYSLR